MIMWPALASALVPSWVCPPAAQAAATASCGVASTATGRFLPHAVPSVQMMVTSPSADGAVKIEYLNPAPALEVKDVVSSVMAALHPSNHDKPSELYGFEVALRFLAPTHAAKRRAAKPGGFARYLRQDHKIEQIKWQEYRFEGDTVFLTSDAGVEEAYQMCSMRQSPSEDWKTSRWKLVLVESDYGETVTPKQWLVEAVYSGEPDTPEDIEFLRSHKLTSGVTPAPENPRKTVDLVMDALRAMDEPYPFHGAVMATRYCSPKNRASELSPQVFAKYLDDPWYSILTEWDERQDDDEDFLLDDYLRGAAEVEVLVKREDDESFTMVSWDMALYDGQWLINSLNII